METHVEQSNVDNNDKENVSNADKDNEETNEEIEERKCIICLDNCLENCCLCTDCLKPVHFRCTVETFNIDGDRMDPSHLCLLCYKRNSIINERNDAKEGLCQQAKKMKITSDKLHPSADVGSTVRVKIPDVDRGRGDPRSVLAVVLEVTDDNYYKLGTRNGIINQLYARSQFSVCDEKLVTTEEVPSKEMSLRTVAIAQSIGTGQGFKKCACTKKCETKKCLCKRSNLLCNSKCHGSNPCTNK
ncbi:uncharacterized protein [Onthophagus taurus]|uniref:uncharacterized protein n=1 Tax=Onthophagus taurus TaxID=166361 RepID=UPI0039BDD372